MPEDEKHQAPALRGRGALQVHRALESMACAGLSVQRLADLCAVEKKVERLVMTWDAAYGRGDLLGCYQALAELQLCLGLFEST